jgi:heme exporter protein C
MIGSSRLFNVLLAIAALIFSVDIFYIFFVTPTAQLSSGGLAQKIFYFHVPSVLFGMFVSVLACGISSAAYLYGATDRRNAWAQGSAECVVAFGAIMLTTGPLWAKKAWGVYWTWDPQLTAGLLTVLIYVAVTVLRAFAGDGDAERRFAAALGLLGTITVPIIHYSVQKWGGNHPVVMRSGGGGLRHPAMTIALRLNYVSMTMFSLLLLSLRAGVSDLRSRLKNAEQRARLEGRIDD